MSVVSDTTAITTLLKAEQAQLLQELFERVFVPQAVWDELTDFHRELPNCVELRPMQNPGRRLPGTETLGRGEAEAVSLAMELNAKLLVTDDRSARAAAKRLNVPCIGLVGVMIQAKRLEKFPRSATGLKLSRRKAVCIYRMQSLPKPRAWPMKPES